MKGQEAAGAEDEQSKMPPDGSRAVGPCFGSVDVSFHFDESGSRIAQRR